MKKLAFIPITTIFSLVISSIAQAEPAKIWTSWEQTKLSQEQCMKRAENAVRKLRFELQVLESGVYGESRNTSVTIRCATEQNLVFFIATHPDTSIAEWELGALTDSF